MVEVNYVKSFPGIKSIVISLESIADSLYKIVMFIERLDEDKAKKSESTSEGGDGT